MSVLLTLGILGVLVLLSALTFMGGFYTAQALQSDAMVRHHTRMLEILEHRIPEYTEVSKSLDIAREEIHDYEPSFFRDFLGRGV